MRLGKETFHKVKLVAQLVFSRRYPYRAEIEKYYIGSSDATMLTFRYFSTFESARNFAIEYVEPYYVIQLYKQVGSIEYSCNFFNVAIVNPNSIHWKYLPTDQYGFEDILGPNDDGWYLRGENTHSADFLSITSDLDFLLSETRRRCNRRARLRRVIRELFAERHPGAAKHYLKNFETFYRLAVELDKSN